MERRFYEDGSAVFLHTDEGHGTGTDIAERRINNRHEKCGNQTGPERVFRNLRFGDRAVHLDRFHHDNAENESGKAVHRIISVNDSLPESFHTGVIAAGACQLPMGEAMALIIKRKRNTRRTGVMNLPTRATSLDGEIASHQVMIKNTAAKT